MKLIFNPIAVSNHRQMRVKEAVKDAADEKMTEAEDEEEVKEVEIDEKVNENIADTLLINSKEVSRDTVNNTDNEAIICGKTPSRKEEPLQAFTRYEMMSEELDNTQYFDNMVRSASEDCSEKDITVQVENIVTHSCKMQKRSSNFDHTYCKSSDNKNHFSDTNHDSNKSMIKQTENEPYYKEHITTRRILDFPWIEHELHEAFDDNHAGSCQGLFRDLQLLRCTDRALLTQMFWQCKKCFKTASIWSKSQKSVYSMSLNESAVLGTLISGIGYTNLKEQLATTNIHVMTDKTYRKYRDKIENSILGISQKEMDEAA
ncbi:hypothetical protein KQX54_015963 [Cotesia glomerata]|uniref:Mutator-like transposase domain-containing protein n=1 Tax=Cotesia glomerata TaxID=32391 RepID=A0AAV7J769_COTGL|nr:hypothetical protein KQX54_015963 [Cotesia glomerata]